MPTTTKPATTTTTGNVTPKPVVMNVEDIMKVLWEDKAGNRYMLDETRRGMFILRTRPREN